MPQSHGAIYLHAVFSTKHRYPFLADSRLRARVHAYLAEVSNTLNCQALAVGGVADHVHALSRLSRTSTTADWVKEMKRASSLWIKREVPELTDFAWQIGYGAFSVSHRLLDATVRYIAQQEDHHRDHSFQEEYRVLLTRHGVPWNEQYVWD